MNLSNLRSALIRRWYVFLPGLLVAVALAYLGHSRVHPSYTRSASMLMIPGQKSMPTGSNPYLYLGGLSFSADVLVRAASSESVLGPILKDHPGATSTVSRDVSTSSPVLTIDVEAGSAAETKPILESTMTAVSTTLLKLQTKEHLPADEQITVTTLSVDTTATAKTKSQLMATAAGGIAGIVLALIATTLVDGQLLSRARRERRPSAAPRRGGGRRSRGSELFDAAPGGGTDDEGTDHGGAGDDAEAGHDSERMTA